MFQNQLILCDSFYLIKNLKVLNHYVLNLKNYVNNQQHLQFLRKYLQLYYLEEFHIYLLYILNHDLDNILKHNIIYIKFENKNKVY